MDHCQVDVRVRIAAGPTDHMNRIPQIIRISDIWRVILHGYVLDQERRVALTLRLFVLRDDPVNIRLIRYLIGDRLRSLEVIQEHQLVESEQFIDLRAVIAGRPVRMHANRMTIACRLQGSVQIRHRILDVKLIRGRRRRQKCHRVTGQYLIFRIRSAASIRRNIQLPADRILGQIRKERARFLIRLKVHPGLHIAEGLVHDDDNIRLNRLGPGCRQGRRRLRFRTAQRFCGRGLRLPGCLFKISGFNLLHSLYAVALRLFHDHQANAAQERQDRPVVSIALFRPEGIHRHAPVTKHFRVQVDAVRQNGQRKHAHACYPPPLPCPEDLLLAGPLDHIAPDDRKEDQREGIGIHMILVTAHHICGSLDRRQVCRKKCDASQRIDEIADNAEYADDRRGQDRRQLPPVRQDREPRRDQDHHRPGQEQLLQADRMNCFPGQTMHIDVRVLQRKDAHPACQQEAGRSQDLLLLRRKRTRSPECGDPKRSQKQCRNDLSVIHRGCRPLRGICRGYHLMIERRIQKEIHQHRCQKRGANPLANQNLASLRTIIRITIHVSLSPRSRKS